MFNHITYFSIEIISIYFISVLFLDLSVRDFDFRNALQNVDQLSV